MAYQKVVDAEEGVALVADTDRHTPMANIDDATDAASRSKLLKTLGLVALVAVGTAGVTMSLSGSARATVASLSSADTWYYDDDQYASSKPWAEESYECKNYKDDDYYTADLCGNYDSVECYEGTFESGNLACNSSYWCSELCGDYCSEGAGAICFFQKLSDLKETCQRVAEIRASDDYETPDEEWEVLSAVKSGLMALSDPNMPAADDDTLGPDINSPSKDSTDDYPVVVAPEDDYTEPLADDTEVSANNHRKKVLNRTSYHASGNVTDDLEDSGCGRHTYCEDCKDYCKEMKMKHYLEESFGARGGYSPRSAKMAIIDILNTCEFMGFSTNSTEIFAIRPSPM
mmetsp:Transcript_5374/g.10924  ORF Transcript_5374/g.10924 Transcript_5374/m.10924 type:complete len:345 (-) Transcript_5374:170-1204(-)|eukprot:CAMPEP_0182542222 /NCGR_PEP_ID=MMETSP1323-20130603/29830_1 /TAXON_ID=236787 /ORGANISM="Florenciella parvula, Strain RCC1693" /LENGTH=344 /DNA_ID=CAMNT_0024753055 /DNA_START=80 /DNA_END=1114 /DNA_ORIENTATION=+